MSRYLRVLVPAVVVAVLAITPGVAQATRPIEHRHYAGTDTFPDRLCGLDLAITVEFHGVLTIRPVRGSDNQAFLAHNNYETTEVITNPVNGRQVTLHANGVFHEYSARHVEGDIWEFEFRDAGTFTVLDAGGNRLLRERGVVNVSQVFDTLGDGMPGGELISEELLSVHGPHASEEVFCDTVVDALT